MLASRSVARSPRRLHPDRRSNTAVHRAATRHCPRTFSSSRAPENLEDDEETHKVSGAAPSSGWIAETRATIARVRARRHILADYVARGVFPPSRFESVNNWIMFYQLNRPRETELDIKEFLEGAKHAMPATMLALYSREFADAVSGALPISDSSAAHQLKQYLKPKMFNDYIKSMKSSAAAGVRLELQQVELHNAHLIGVDFQRVPVRSTTNSNGAFVVGVPTQERLKLQVLFGLTEHFAVEYPNEKSTVVRTTESVWQFESAVTTPDEIDWTIEPLQLTTV